MKNKKKKTYLIDVNILIMQIIRPKECFIMMTKKHVYFPWFGQSIEWEKRKSSSSKFGNLWYFLFVSFLCPTQEKKKFFDSQDSNNGL